MKHEKRIGHQRLRRRLRVRRGVKLHSTRPRLSVFRSHKHIYAQIIDDLAGRTLVAASTQDKQLRGQLPGGKQSAAQAVGALIAKRAIEAGIRQVAFDRREYRYHGRVAALADAARDAGLDLGAKKVIEAPAEPAPKKGEKKSADKKPKDKGEKAEKGEKGDKAEKAQAKKEKAAQES